MFRVIILFDYALCLHIFIIKFEVLPPPSPSPAEQKAAEELCTFYFEFKEFDTVSLPLSNKSTLFVNEEYDIKIFLQRPSFNCLKSNSYLNIPNGPGLKGGSRALGSEGYKRGSPHFALDSIISLVSGRLIMKRRVTAKGKAVILKWVASN